MNFEITQRMTWHEKVFAGPIITYDGFITSLVDYNFHNKIFSSLTDNKLRYIYIYIYIFIYLFSFTTSLITARIFNL